MLLSLKRACPLMASPWVRARSLSKHAHFVVVNRRSKRRIPWKSSRNLGGEEEEVATCDCVKFLSLFHFFFYSFLEFSTRRRWIENSRVSHFVTTGFRFGFKGRGGKVEERLFFGTKLGNGENNDSSQVFEFAAILCLLGGARTDVLIRLLRKIREKVWVSLIKSLLLMLENV